MFYVFMLPLWRNKRICLAGAHAQSSSWAVLFESWLQDLKKRSGKRKLHIGVFPFSVLRKMCISKWICADSAV